MSARALALDVLVRVDAGAFSHIALPAALRASDLDARDRAFVTELVYGTLRRRRAVDHLLGLVLDRPVDRVDPPVRAVLRLGTYQLVEGVAPHAAVGETVAACPPGPSRRFVNAVLRHVAALGPPWPWPEGDDLPALAVRASVPDWIAARLAHDLGSADARAVLDAANEPAALTLRPNRRRTSTDALARDLATVSGRVDRGALVSDALVVSGVGDPGTLVAVREGRATPQDQASQAVVGVLGPQPGEHVLDVAAGPGGKTTAIAERLDDRGAVLAVERHLGRARTIRRAACRLGLGSVLPVVADGRALPARPGSFDRALVDAPCSGLGVLRRRPEARWRVVPDTPERLAPLQRALVAGAADAVRPGGVLVYSVCTLTEIETLGLDGWAAGALPGFTPIAPPAAPWREHGRGALLLPHAAGTDGMYVLVLRRGR